MKLLYLLLFTSLIYANNYNSLRVYKENNPSKIEEQVKKEILVHFQDITSFDFYGFEREYNMSLKVCIADAICIFTIKEGDKFEELFKDMKKRTDLKSIELYQQEILKSY